MKKFLFIITLSSIAMGFANEKDTHSAPPRADQVMREQKLARSTYQNRPNNQVSEPVRIAPVENTSSKLNQNAHNGLIVDVDFIYWIPKLDGLEFVKTGVSHEFRGGFSSNSTLPQGQLYSPNQKFAPGFKASLGYDFDHGGWDLLAEYTWIYQSSSRSLTDNVDINYDDNLKPLLRTNFGFDVYFEHLGVGSAKSKWHLHFNNWDLSLGRKIYIKDSISLRPHFGLKGTYQKQKLDIDYRNYLTRSFSLSKLNNNSFDFDQDFWGIGIRAGLDSSWKIVKYFGVFGNFSLAALWGQFKVTSQEFIDMTLENFTGTVDYTNVNALNDKSSFKTIKPVFEFSLGLYGECFFSQDTMRLRLQLAWEEQLWLSQNQFYISSFSLGPTTGDLSFQGLTAKLLFDF